MDPKNGVKSGSTFGSDALDFNPLLAPFLSRRLPFPTLVRPKRARRRWRRFGYVLSGRVAGAPRAAGGGGDPAPPGGGGRVARRVAQPAGCLVQASTTLPIMLFSLAAGAIADNSTGAA